MSDIMDYLAWRGDIPLEGYPLGEVDNLIFSLLSYVDFDGVLPSDPHAAGMTVREAAKEYFFIHPDLGENHLGLIVPVEILSMFRLMADAPRFRDLILTGYVNEICEEREMQFSALTVRLPDNGVYVAFRGTDDTLVGWKEDFNLAYMDEVPSQRKAADYLNALAPAPGTRLYVGGHSKGGNLAVWGAVHANESVRAAIVNIYSNDGPGFTAEMLASETYRALSNRMTFLLPESSLVGLLLEHADTYEVIKSNRLGLSQHNALTWEIMGGHFVRVKGLSPKGVRTDTVVRARIDAMDREEKRTLVRLLFDVLESTGAKTLTELNDGKIKHAVTMLRTLNEFDKETKETALYLVSKLFDTKMPAVSADNTKKPPAVASKEAATSALSGTARSSQMPVPDKRRKGRIRVELRILGKLGRKAGKLTCYAQGALTTTSIRP